MTLVILAASSIGLSLGIFGSGGAVLALPVLVYLAGHEPKLAITGALFIVAAISTLSLLLSHSKRLVDWQLALRLGITGMLGAYMGAWLGSLVSGLVQLSVFALLMLMASGFMYRGKIRLNDKQTSLPLMLGVGTVVGMLTGFTGVGGGFLLVPAILRFTSLDFFRARATSLVLISVSAWTGFSKSAWLLPSASQLDWTLLLIIAAMGVAGSLLGQRWSANWPQHNLRKGFALLLLTLACFILYQNLS
ncbi:sulfite exporter TauE/SafE family protein [Lacimicrobium sp. SS2-24]|uniref:sulfite exporter TauE/SafE family protein n=1 Tax=Lacimicrobium sp. SS2-24 TaxID=2005569 RepID=UPI001439AAB6|nr:sulfite exporter TauE/SafE family protein [Lacimicrobium sp. SS2-24]